MTGPHSIAGQPAANGAPSPPPSADPNPALSPPSRASALAVAFGGLCAMAAAIGIGRFVYTPILPAMGVGLHLSDSATGLIASANFLGYLIGAILAAIPDLPGSRRAWLIAGLIAVAVTTGAMGLGSSMAVFLALRFLAGGASAFGLILASAIVLERLSELGHSRLSALHFAGVGSGIAASAALVEALLQTGAGWRALWLASGGLSLIAAAAAAVLLPRPAIAAGPPAPTERDGAGAGLRQLVIAYGLFGFGYVITATFLVAIVRRTPSIRPVEPAVWILFGLAAAPSVALWSRAARPLGIPAAFTLACVVEAAGVVASVAWQTQLGVFVATILVGGTFMGLTALGLIQARLLTRGDPRRALAWMTGAFALGQIVGPAFAGMLSDWLGSFTAASFVAAAALLVAAALAGAR
jgi:predicted MFS family arabinose efflux permease